MSREPDGRGKTRWPRLGVASEDLLLVRTSSPRRHRFSSQGQETGLTYDLTTSTIHDAGYHEERYNGEVGTKATMLATCLYTSSEYGEVSALINFGLT